ncbi:RNA polymerase sigma factor [uncultured Ruminococcus sp.]|uniref:RNA polymerase sigma factor n=1 Tax=uncultured Ruminococcus sp. TaxID=165186 RepID=UPI0025E4E589|nr:RNA polymerase sigma factor [uncultured Ruminococcus sp.]
MNRRTKARLAAAAAEGDTQAFSELYGEIYKQLYYYALANLRSTEDAADAVQDAVLDAFSSISKLKKSSAFDSWMFRILSTKIKRKQAEYSQSHVSIDEINESDALIKDTVSFEKCEILEEFANLNENERLCITLNCIAGYKSSEISEITGINIATVRSYISRGRKKMKTGLYNNCKEVT